MFWLLSGGCFENKVLPAYNKHQQNIDDDGEFVSMIGFSSPPLTPKDLASENENITLHYHMIADSSKGIFG